MITRIRFDWSKSLVWLVLLVLIIVSAILSPTFTSSRNISNVVRQSAGIGLVSLGQTFAILTAGIDLSVGSIISLTACLTTGILHTNPELVVPVIFLVIGIAAGLGLINGLVITITGVHPLIVTLGMMSAVQGVVLVYTKEPYGSIPASMAFLAWGKVWAIPFPVVWFLVCAIIGIIILRKTPFGRYVYAVGGNIEAARLSGIKTKRILVSVYIISAVSASFTGLLLSSRMGMGDPLIGEPFMLNSIAPVVLGGTSIAGGKGGIGGTIAGVLIVAILANILNLMGVSGFYQWIVKGLIIIVAVAFYRK